MFYSDGFSHPLFNLASSRTVIWLGRRRFLLLLPQCIRMRVLDCDRRKMEGVEVAYLFFFFGAARCGAGRRPHYIAASTMWRYGQYGNSMLGERE